MVLMTKQPLSRRCGGAAQTALKRTTQTLRVFLVPSELLHRPHTHAASMGARYSRGTLHLHSACAWSERARKHLSSNDAAGAKAPKIRISSSRRQGLRMARGGAFRLSGFRTMSVWNPHMMNIESTLPVSELRLLEFDSGQQCSHRGIVVTVFAAFGI